MTEKAALKWSKKESDWIANYSSNSGKTISCSFFDMIRKFEDFMSKDWQGKPTEFKDFREYLRNGGFDPDTFTISVKKLSPESYIEKSNEKI